MSSNKRAFVGVVSPLEDAGILLHVLNILGPGHHLFVSAVSKAWRESYRKIANVQIPDLTSDYDEEPFLITVIQEETLFSAVFASASRVNLAFTHGLPFDDLSLQRIAGRVADIPVLQAARELGLAFTEELLVGAAEAALVPKLQWLHIAQGCRLRQGLTCFAARSGSTSMLRCLKEHGCVYSTNTCEGAAAGGHQHVLQFLRDQGCEWDESACSAAAEHGHLSTLKWLHEHGCPWDADEICDDAAQSGSTELLTYLSSKGVTSVPALWLLLHGVGVLLSATAGGHLETLRFLHETGFPWNPARICEAAAVSGKLELLHYVKQQ
eukprot:3062-Heterococcus_DN1.PRE.2